MYDEDRRDRADGRADEQGAEHAEGRDERHHKRMVDDGQDAAPAHALAARLCSGDVRLDGFGRGKSFGGGLAAPRIGGIRWFGHCGSPSHATRLRNRDGAFAHYCAAPRRGITLIA